VLGGSCAAEFVSSHRATGWVGARQSSCLFHWPIKGQIAGRGEDRFDTCKPALNPTQTAVSAAAENRFDSCEPAFWLWSKKNMVAVAPNPAFLKKKLVSNEHAKMVVPDVLRVQEKVTISFWVSQCGGRLAILQVT